MAFLVAGLMAFTVSQVSAVQATFDAAVEILAPLEIDEDVPLDFGQIVRPTADENEFQLLPAGGPVIVTGAGDGTHVDGTQVPGDLSITGGAVGGSGAAVTDITALPLACTLGGVTLTDVALTGTPGTTPFNVAVGGTVEVTSGAALGAGTCAYTVEALFN